MSLSIGGLPSPSQLLSGLGPPLPPLLRGGFADGMRTMTLQTASQVFPQVNFQSGGSPAGGALPGGQGMQLPLPGGQTLTLPGPPVPGGGPASRGPAGGMPAMPPVPASAPGAAMAASAPGQLLGNAAAAVRNLLPSAPPPGPPAQAGMAAGPTTAGPALAPVLAQATALPGRAVPATTASLAGTAPAPVAAPASAAAATTTAGVQSPGGPLAQALQSTPAAPNVSAAAPASTTTTAAVPMPSMPAPAAPPTPSGPGLQAGRGEGVPGAPQAPAAPQQAPPAQAPSPAVPAGPGPLAAPLVAAAALQAPAGTAVAGAASPAGNPQATAPVAGDLGGPSRAELIATGVYTAEGPGLRRRQRMRIGPEAIGAWLLALRQGQPLLVRPHDDARREVARAMQWVFWTLALVAYGCLAVVLAGFLLVDGDILTAPALRRWSGELALIGLAAAAGAWWFARALARPARPGPSSD